MIRPNRATKKASTLHPSLASIARAAQGLDPVSAAATVRHNNGHHQATALRDRLELEEQARLAHPRVAHRGYHLTMATAGEFERMPHLNRPPTPYFSAENLVGVRIELLIDAIIGPPSSLLLRTAIQSGSA